MPDIFDIPIWEDHLYPVPAYVTVRKNSAIIVFAAQDLHRGWHHVDISAKLETRLSRYALSACLNNLAGALLEAEFPDHHKFYSRVARNLVSNQAPSELDRKIYSRMKELIPGFNSEPYGGLFEGVKLH